jgi:hypothetical protein
VTPLACYFALISIGGVPADLRGTLAFSDSSQAIVRPSTVRRGDTIDLNTMPAGEMTFLFRHSAFSFGYGPLLTLQDAFRPESTFLYLHAAHATYGRSWRRYQLSLAENVTLGEKNFSNLTSLTAPPAATAPSATAAPGATGAAGATAAPGAAPMPGAMPGAMMASTTSPSGQLQPANRPLWIFTENTTAALGHAISHRTSISFSVGYGVSGGLREEDRQYLVQQRSETAGLTLGYRLSTRDGLGATGGVTRTETSNGFEHLVVIESGTYTHAINRRLTGNIGAGVAQDWSRGPDGKWTFTPYPTASAGLTGELYAYRRRSYTLTVSFGSTLAPSVNPITGELRETLSGGLNVLWAGSRTTVSGTMSAAQTFPVDDTSARFVGLGLVASHKLGALVDVSAGYATALQISQDARLSFSRQWVAFAGITIRAPAISF